MKKLIKEMSTVSDVFDATLFTKKKNRVSEIYMFPIPHYSHRTVVIIGKSDGSETMLDFHHEVLNEFIGKYIKESGYDINDFS